MSVSYCVCQDLSCVVNTNKLLEQCKIRERGRTKLKPFEHRRPQSLRLRLYPSPKMMLSEEKDK